MADTDPGAAPVQGSGTFPETLAAAATRALRRHVGEAGRRRLLPRRAWVGVVEGERRLLPEADWYDDAVRADLLGAALAGIDAPPQAPLCAWVTRSGPLRPAPPDLSWLRAAHTAFDRHDARLAAFLLISRKGWTDLLSGATAEFARVRPLPVSLR